MEDLKAHFSMGYAPNNCVMVVVGDVSDRRSAETRQGIHGADPPAGSASSCSHSRADRSWANDE